MNNLKVIEDTLIPNALEKIRFAYGQREKNQFRPTPEDEGQNQCQPRKETYIVFPKKRDNKYRVSEQEFRFAFIEALAEYNKGVGNVDKIYYSVETPTSDVYRFSKNEDPKIAEEGVGKSGSFDLTLYSKDKDILALIEFKAHNVDERYVWKDLLKLQNPNEGSAQGTNVARYFLWLFESINSGTVESVEKKIAKAKDVSNMDNLDCVNCRCYVLSDNEYGNTPIEFYRYPKNPNK